MAPVQVRVLMSREAAEMADPIRKDLAEMAEEEKDEKSTEGPTAADIDKMQAALKKANDEAAKFRHEAKAKDEELAEMKKAQDSSKSEMDKVREQLAALEERAEKAERDALVAKVAQAKKLPAALASRLTGDSLEELEADADGLIDELGLNSDDKDEDDSEKKPNRRPKERLRPGASNDKEETVDADKVADDIFNENAL